MKKILKISGAIVYTLFVIFACVSCSENEGVVGTGLTVNATAQKGPFINGSNVLVNILNSNGTNTDRTLTSEITDDFGSFSFTLDKPELVNITVTGFHFNELSGVLSNSQLSLGAVYQASNATQGNIYVNVLTHLISLRVLTLIGDGIPVGEAISTAQKEIINAFKSFLIADKLSQFEKLSIYNLENSQDEGNAYLLALSSIVYQYATTHASSSGAVDAQLSSLLSTLRTDFSDDGKIANQTLLNDLVEASQQLNPTVINNNLQKRSLEVLGKTLDVPDINLFIDTDGDGIANAKDSDKNGDGVPDTETQGLFTQVFEDVVFTSVIPTSDGEYIGAGQYKAENSGQSRMIVMKLDQLGFERWRYTLEPSEAGSAITVIEDVDGNYITLADYWPSVTADSENDRQITLLKLDSLGKNPIKKTYTSFGGQFSKIIEHQNGFYISSAKAAPIPIGNASDGSLYSTNAVILSIDKQFNTIWETSLMFPNNVAVAVNDFYILNNNNLLLAGAARLPEASSNNFKMYVYTDNPYIAVLSPDGDQINAVEYNDLLNCGTETNSCISLIKDYEGEFKLFVTLRDGSNLRYDLDSNYELRNAIDSSPYLNQMNVPDYTFFLENGGYVIFDESLAMTFYDGSDIEISTVQFGSNTSSEDIYPSNNIVKTPDGGYLLNWRINQGEVKAALIRIDSNGNSLASPADDVAAPVTP